MKRETLSIVTCIKQVPGTSEVEIDEHGSLVRSGIETKMNPYDLFAIEAAMQLKGEWGATHGQGKATVAAISMGPPQAVAVLKEAFMMGVDKGWLLSDRRFAGADVLATARTIAKGIEATGLPDIILCGKQTTDGDTAQVGPEIAEMLGIPHVTNIMSIQANEENAIVEADAGDAIQTCSVRYPCLFTVEKDANQPRLPSFKRKLHTREWPIPALGLDDLGSDDEDQHGMAGSPTKVVEVFPPPSKSVRETWRGEPCEVAARIVEKIVSLKLLE